MREAGAVRDRRRELAAESVAVGARRGRQVIVDAPRKVLLARKEGATTTPVTSKCLAASGAPEEARRSSSALGHDPFASPPPPAAQRAGKRLRAQCKRVSARVSARARGSTHCAAGAGRGRRCGHEAGGTQRGDAAKRMTANARGVRRGYGHPRGREAPRGVASSARRGGVRRSSGTTQEAARLPKDVYTPRVLQLKRSRALKPRARPCRAGGELLR